MAATARPWTAFYGPDVPQEVGPAPYRTVPDMVHAVAQTYRDAPAFTVCLPNGMNGTLSFAEVDEMSDALAVYLREVAGLARGDRVAVQLPNCLAFPVAAFGVFKAGCVLVNVNPLYTAEEMAKLFRDARPHAVVAVDMFADKLAEACRGQPIPNVVITRVAEFMPALPRWIVGLVQRHWDRTVKPVEMAHVRLPQALSVGRAHRASGRIDVTGYRRDLRAEDVACLQYTGGTTGVAKGAMLTHANLIVNMQQTMALITGLRRGEEVALTALPLYHIFAFTVNLLAFYWLGARNVLVPNPRPLSNLKRAFENYPITWMSGVNTLFRALANEVWFTDSPPRRLKFAVAGGMALQTAVAQRWEAVTGKPVLQGYGLTETAPVVAFNPPGKAREGTIGLPVPSTDVVCLDDAGQPVPPGTAGEIAVKGPQVMAGYWGRSEDSAGALRDGWFLTGDIGVMDADGYLTIVDRKKDMIVVSGFNVYPNEVEDCLAGHPGIAEAAVVGLPDDDTGEAVTAVVVRRDPGLGDADIRRHCRAHMTAYKVPKTVVFRDDLPKSPIGKILRKDLRAALAAERAG